MLIDVTRLRSLLETSLIKEFRSAGHKKHKPTLALIQVGETDNLVSLRQKKEIAKKLGVNIKLLKLDGASFFQNVLQSIKTESEKEEIHAAVIRHPLPAQLQSDSVYDFIPLLKEIEGHRRKSPYFHPVGLAVLTMLKHIYAGDKKKSDMFASMPKDALLLKRLLKNKKIMLVGYGADEGKMIGETLTSAKINYITLGDNTEDISQHLKEADVIICASGRKIIGPECLKPGVILFNLKLHDENGKKYGNYLKSEIESIAGFYTSPNDNLYSIVNLCLFRNFLDAIKRQKIR